MPERRKLLRGALLAATATTLTQNSNEAAASASSWTLAYGLDAKRKPVAGSAAKLADAIRRGADLRIGTAFRHNEHIDTSSKSKELVQEVAEFRTTYLLGDRWTAGFMTLRLPISLPDSFGPRASMSFFLYNQDGTQAIARPHLDGLPATGQPGPSPWKDDPSMPKYHQHDSQDADTNAPSHNFVYDFEEFRYLVRDDWREVLSHSARGAVRSGSVKALADAFASGCEVKVAVRNLCRDLAEPDAPADHEVFVQAGSCYYYTEQALFIAGTHPLVRVRPAVPLRYRSRGWDFGWLMARTDGQLQRWLVDPYTLQFRKSRVRCDLRWFVR
jgi:hypothetical protein